MTTQPTTTTQPGQPSLAAAQTVVDGSALGSERWSDGSSSTGGQGLEIGGLTCSNDSASYAYTQLILLNNGEHLALPANIGTGTPTIRNPATCVYPVHTRDRTGKIRVNTSNGATYTLGQFFAVWGQTLSSTQVADIEGPATIYLNDNGTLTPFTGDPATIELRPQRQIVVMLGTPLAQIPNFAWEALPPLAGTPVILEGGDTGATRTPIWDDGNAATGGTGAPVGSLACAADLIANLDLNTHLSIYRNGEQLILPQGIGRISTITPACDYEVHTHDRSGTIHTASTEYKRFTLGDFFAIWGQPLSLTNVAGFTDAPIVIYIEDKGDLRRFIGNPTTIDLASHRSIVIQIGTPLTEIPTYDWLNFGPF
ncbi:MAG TPA: hypothetical protein DHV59_02250 [Oxalobacteraceae bacterium]|nr:hypothetical protein [Oxalobacteraceae bacterium]